MGPLFVGHPEIPSDPRKTDPEMDLLAPPKARSLVVFNLTNYGSDLPFAETHRPTAPKERIEVDIYPQKGKE